MQGPALWLGTGCPSELNHQHSPAVLTWSEPVWGCGKAEHLLLSQGCACSRALQTGGTGGIFSISLVANTAPAL